MEQKKRKIVSIFILMLYLTFFLSVAHATDFSTGTATVSTTIIIPIDGGLLQQITWFIASISQEPTRLANVSVTIYELPDNNTVCNLMTDEYGMANATLPRGEYYYVAHYNDQTLTGNFTQIEESTIYLEFIIATPTPLTKVAVGLGIIGIGVVGIYSLNRQVKKKRRMRRPNAPEGNGEKRREPNLKPESKHPRPNIGERKKPRWKHPRPESYT